MKNLNFNQIENLHGGICLIVGSSGNCLPCAALLQELNALHAGGELIACAL